MTDIGEKSNNTIFTSTASGQITSIEPGEKGKTILTVQSNVTGDSLEYVYEISKISFIFAAIASDNIKIKIKSYFMNSYHDATASRDPMSSLNLI